MKGKIIGQSIPKVDAVSKVTGQAKYATDLVMDDMLYMMALRAPYPHAIIRKIDIEKARQVPGIVQIITRQDLEDLNNFGLIIKDQPTLVGVGEKTRYLGDTLALIIGESLEQIQIAKELIEVDYDKLEVITDPFRAMEEDAPFLHQDGNIVCSHKLAKGDIVQGFMEADLIVYNEFKTQHLEHVPLQPDAGMAAIDEEGIITIWAATQWIHDTRVDVAQALGLSVDKVRIIQPAIGGAFGKREDVIVQLHLAIAAKMTNRPIKTIYSREESIISTSKRHPITFKMKTGVKKDGSLTAWETTVIGDTGAYASSGPAVVHKGLYHCTGPYNCPNVKGKAFTVYTNNTYAGAMRGFGATQTAFAYESQMNIIAEKLRMDPIELRLKNIYQVGSTTPNGQVLHSSVGAKETIVKAVDTFEESRRVSITSPHSYKRRGIGIATIMFGFGYGEGFPDHSIARLTIKDDGRVELNTAAADVGQGVHTVVSQIAAEVLSVPIDQIDLISGDTLLTKSSGSTSATRQTFFTGNAVKNTAQALKGLIFDMAVKYYSRTYPEFYLESGFVVPHGARDEKVSLKELAWFATNQGEKLTVESCFFPETTPPDPETGQGEKVYVSYTFVTQLAEVEVNIRTGQVQVLRFVTAPDVGQAIHPQNVEGQIEGGTSMGLGMALMEEIKFDEEGFLMNPDLSTYLIPTAMDMPRNEVILVEDEEPQGPYGAKGIGEPAAIATAPAIVNAIYDACGVRIKELPVTPEKILKGLERKDNYLL